MINRRQFIQGSATLAALSAAGAFTRAFAASRPFVFVSRGGALSEMEKTAFTDPFSKKVGKEIANVSPTKYAKIKAMVESGNTEWDLVTVGGRFAYDGRDQGLLEEIDYRRIPNAKEIDPGYRGQYGTVTSTGATVIAWNNKAISEAPKSWADFWDVKRFPGPRGLYKYFYYNYEAAMLAAGTKRADVYPVTAEKIDVVFEKMKEIKPHVKVWWSSGAQPPQLLSSGELAMSSAWDGRMRAIAAENAPTSFTLDDGLAWGNAWVVPKGTPYKDMAMDLINYALSLEAQTRMIEANVYGPVNPTAAANAPAARRKEFVTAPENANRVLVMNEEQAAYYVREFDKRWQEFQLG
jgi:putative spermidine/putrescine transport system substrate-binding protein